MQVFAITWCKEYGKSETTTSAELTTSFKVSGLSKTFKSIGSTPGYLFAKISASSFNCEQTTIPIFSSLCKYSTTGADTYPAPNTITYSGKIKLDNNTKTIYQTFIKFKTNLPSSTALLHFQYKPCAYFSN